MEVRQSKKLKKNCQDLASYKSNLSLSFFQSNIEGELVEKIQTSVKRAKWINN